MSGKIQGISGPTVSVDLKGLKLYERVYVGHAMLTGEVVRLERDRAVVQVYEDTRGLGRGRTGQGRGHAAHGAARSGSPGRHVRRPPAAARTLREEMGPFITGGREIYALDYMKRWQFSPVILKKGDDGGLRLHHRDRERGCFQALHHVRHQGRIKSRPRRRTAISAWTSRSGNTKTAGRSPDATSGRCAWPGRTGKSSRLPRRSSPASGASIFSSRLRAAARRSSRRVRHGQDHPGAVSGEVRRRRHRGLCGLRRARQ